MLYKKHSLLLEQKSVLIVKASYALSVTSTNLDCPYAGRRSCPMVGLRCVSNNRSYPYIRYDNIRKSYKTGMSFMSSKNDIREPYEWTKKTRTGLVYSKVLGWIDLGHAGGRDIEELILSFRMGEASRKERYTVTYTQSMYAFGKRVGAGKFARWDIKRGRTPQEIQSIALSMMLSVASRFERYQSSAMFAWYTDSGFSGEDLVSDLLGFYRAILPTNYQNQLQLVSKEKAIKIWDYYGGIGKYKNTSFLPIIFPDPDDPCVIKRPYKTQLPHFLKWVQPFARFNTDIVKVGTNNGTFLSLLAPNEAKK